MTAGYDAIDAQTTTVTVTVTDNDVFAGDYRMFWTGTDTGGNRRNGFELGRGLAGTGELNTGFVGVGPLSSVFLATASRASDRDGDKDLLQMYGLSQPFSVGEPVTLTVDNSGAVTEGGSLTLTASIPSVAAADVTIPLQVTAGATAVAADYSLPATVTIAAGTSSGTATFTATDDVLDEPSETLTVELGTLPAGFVAGTTSSVAITIADNDAAPSAITLSVDADTGTGGVQNTVGEGGGAKFVRVTATITSTTRFATAQTVTVTVGASSDTAVEGTDYATVHQQSITIAAGAASGNTTFRLTPTDDDFDEPTQQISVTGGGIAG